MCEYRNMKATCKLLTAKPRTLTAARAFRDTLLNVQADGLPLRLWPVVIDAEDGGYHVCELGFATANDFSVIQ